MKRLLLSLILLISAYRLQAQTATLYATGYHQPNNLSIDAAGNLYVATYGDNNVVKTNPAGAILATYTGFNDPFGLAFDQAGNLYVGSEFGGKIVKIDAAGSSTTFATGFTTLTGMAFDATGNLYVADNNTGTISKVDATGAVTSIYSGIPNPISIVIDAAGNLYVCSSSGNTVTKMDPGGAIIATYPGFGFPQGLALDPAGNLYITGFGSNEIGFIPVGSPSGTPPTDFLSGLPFTPSILTYHDHALYALDGISSVYKITGGILTHQTHHYVKQDATGANNGSSWADAYTDFQAAIDASESGDSLFVAATATPYQPASGTGFSMKEGVKIFGGFLGSETDFSQRNLANKPTLQGNGNSVITNINNGLTAAAVLDGFIITGGYANTNTNGGHGGGGIYNLFVSPTYSHLIISGNGCNDLGGGIGIVYGSPLLDHVTIKNNTATDGGGGIDYTDASPSLRNVLISGNNADLGGGIRSASGSVTLTNVTVTGNTATSGGGIYLGGSYTCYNSIIWGNSSSSANEMYVDDAFNGSMVMHHSLYRNGANDVVDPMGAITATDNNLTVDPAFADATNGNYQLTAASPCIDAGMPDTTGLNIGTTDLAGSARVAGSAIDIGAYEYDGALPVKLLVFKGIFAKPQGWLRVANSYGR